MEMPDGTTRAFDGDVHVRATEYTVGQTGPDAMPGPLPATSAYTYAADFAVDEARTAGAAHVRFTKPVIGYLALHQKIGILPIYLWGTFEAYPKGMTIPKRESLGAKVGAKIGRFLSYEELRDMTEGVPNTEAYRLIAARVQHEVENMQSGSRDKFDVAAVRKAWKAERRKMRKQQAFIEE